MKMTTRVGGALGALVMMGSPVLADGWHRAASPGLATSCCETNWSGVYAGIAVGYSIATTEITDNVIDYTIPNAFYTIDEASSHDVTGTLTLGYDHQVMPGVVLGVFGDYTFGELNSTVSLGYPGGYNLSLEYDNTWAVGGRVGFAQSCCTMWFVTAGYTSTDIDLEGLNDQLDGYFFGGGVEQALHGGFSLKLEYRYANYGDTRLLEVDQGCCYESIDADSEMHSIRLGINYKFGRREQAAYEPMK